VYWTTVRTSQVLKDPYRSRAKTGYPGQPSLANDRHGADYVAEFRHGQTRLIEAKIRAQDWLPRGQDADLALETWADIDNEVIGWTRDTAKLSDYLVFVWLESGRSLLLDARLLRAWFCEHWETLRAKYGGRIIPSKRRDRKWRSEAVYVPHRDVIAQLAYHQGYVPHVTRTPQSGLN
jgi:hypothetical protein